MDEEIKTGEMINVDDTIAVEEDYTVLEIENPVVIDDSSDETDENEIIYEEAIGYKTNIDEAKEEMKNRILAILEKGEITSEDNSELELLQDKYTENFNALKSLANEKDINTSVNKDSNESIETNMDYDEIMKAISEKADWLYIDESGQIMLNGEVVPKLKVMELEAEKIKADVGEFKDLTTENFQAVNAKIDNLEVTDLTAVNADITNLKALVAEIQTLIGGNLTMDNIQSLVLTSDKVTIADALIKNAMIDSISANKIDSGTINTNNVSIQSADGSMVINGTTQQFKDKNGKVRIQIGKDATGNFTFALFSQDGVGVLIDENGIKSGAVPNGLIVNDMVADGANISGSKLDINSVISNINNGTTTIKGTRIQLDEQGQSLEVAFNQLKSKVETIENVTIDGDLSSVIEQVSTNTTSIGVMQGQISSLISNTTITKENGEVVQLKDEYNSTKDTVNSHTTKIGALETNYDKVTGDIASVSSKQSILEQNLDGFKTTVSNTYQTKEDMTNYASTSQMLSAIDQKANQINMTVSNTYATKNVVEDLNANLTTNYSTTQQMNSAINQKADSIINTVSSTYATTQSTSTLLKESITEYYLSTSNTTLSGGAWGTTPYTPTPGKYIWQRTRTVTNAGEIKYSNPICVSDEAYSVMITSDVLLLKCDSDGRVV